MSRFTDTRHLALSIVPILFFIANISCFAGDSARDEPFSGLKIVCVWSVAAGKPEAVDSAVARAQDLGFNGVCWGNPAVVEACRERGIKAFVIVCPLDRQPGAQLQVLERSEDKLTGFRPESIVPEQYYQYGGEPSAGNREILNQNLICPNDPGVVEYSLGKIAAAVDAGYAGIVLDFVGYRNYHSCNCELCLKGLAEFRAGRPDMTCKESAGLFFENQLVELYDSLYTRIKLLAPDLIVANHIHPVYLPNQFYGHRLNTDYCGTTVSWFFKPHWPREKVEDYLRKVLDGPYSHGHAQGMPMIGFYTDWPDARNRKGPERLRLDFELLEKYGAQHLMFCELGHILRDREAYDIIKKYLAGR